MSSRRFTLSPTTPSLYRDAGPNDFNTSERPGSLQEPVARGSQTGGREQNHEERLTARAATSSRVGAVAQDAEGVPDSAISSNAQNKSIEPTATMP